MSEPIGYTQVADAFDEGDPIDVNVHLGFLRESQSSTVRREVVDASSGDGRSSRHLDRRGRAARHAQRARAATRRRRLARRDGVLAHADRARRRRAAAPAEPRLPGAPTHRLSGAERPTPMGDAVPLFDAEQAAAFGAALRPAQHRFRRGLGGDQPVPHRRICRPGCCASRLVQHRAHDARVPRRRALRSRASVAAPRTSARVALVVSLSRWSNRSSASRTRTSGSTAAKACSFPGRTGRHRRSRVRRR